jgi:hypothetical protein
VSASLTFHVGEVSNLDRARPRRRAEHECRARLLVQRGRRPDPPVRVQG